MNEDEAPDLRLRVFIWGTDSRKEPQLEYFGPDRHQQAIGWAWGIANAREDISRVQVIDAWGMLIAQFCARALYEKGG